MNWIHLIRNVRHPFKDYLRNPYHVAENVRWRWRPGTSTERHIFVIGAPRSGTTLLQLLLGNHPACCTWEAETAVFTWQNIFTSQQKIFGLESSRVSDFFRECSDVVEFFDACAREFRLERGGQVLVEKTPQHIFRTQFLLKHFPQSSVVHIHRDGRDCYCSARSASIPHGETPKEFARYWSKCIQARLDASAEQVVDVSYESLVASPKEELGRIMQSVGLSFDEQQLLSSRRAEDPRTENDKFARLGQKIDASSRGRWKEELDRYELQTFEQIAGQQLNALGYDLSTST